MSEPHSTTMVRVVRSSGDLEFRRESRDEDVKVKTEHEIEVSAEEISPRTCEYKGSPYCQSFERGFNDKKMKGIDRSVDLEDKPRPPPKVPSGTTANHSEKSDQLDESPTAKATPYAFVDASSDVTTKKTTESSYGSSRQMIQAPGSQGKIQEKIKGRKDQRSTRKMSKLQSYRRSECQRSIHRLERGIS